MTTLNPIASICSLANWISSASKAAVAGRTRPTVSPGLSRFGLMMGGLFAAAVMSGAAFVDEHDVVGVCQVFAEEVFAGDHAAFLCRYDVAAGGVVIRGGCVEAFHQRVGGGEFAGAVVESGADAVDAVDGKAHLAE